MAPPGRVVALGASNLTRGFQTLVATARATWGEDVEVLAALGHGRSYGAQSRFLVRTLPGILQSDLWRDLARRPRVPTRAIVSDVGNDILYGFSHGQILAWVEETLDRLTEVTDDIVLTGLPNVGEDDISRGKFLFFRSMLFPRCRLSFTEVADTAARLSEGIAEIARTRELRYVELKREWYGIDPIHFRPAVWRAAWQEIACGDGAAALGSLSPIEAVRLYCMRPHRQQLLGIECGAEQCGLRLPSGARVWLY